MTRYRITVRGSLSARLSSTFERMTAEPGGGHTDLIGDLTDQAQLYGVLDQLRNLGIELVSVRPEVPA